MKPGKPRVRLVLGTGETVPTGDNFFAQVRYLNALQRRAPRAMKELVAIQTTPAGPPNTARWLLDKPTEEALRQWADRWGLPYRTSRIQPGGWWMNQIRQTIRGWSRHPRLRGKWVGHSAAFWEPDFPALAGWNPNVERQADFRKRVDAYIVAVKNTPGVDTAPTNFDAHDFDALALEIGAQMPIPRIKKLLRLPDKDDSTIRKRNADLARLLGLTLRRQRGRPALKRKT